MKEKTFENQVKQFLKDNGAWFVKTWSNGIQRKGIPDIIACVNGYFIGIELKAENGKPSELQKWNVKKIREAGGVAIVLYPDQFETFKGYIKALNHNIVCNNGLRQYHFDRE